MKKLFKAEIVVVVVISFLLGSKLLASELISINEIAWMGTTVSSNDEWIELKNNSSNDIDLDGWILASLDGAPSITLSGTIPVNGYFLLERSDDNSVLNILADQIYSGALGNSGEFLELRDGENNLVDTIDASAGWPAGDNSSKLTMEKNNGEWQSSQDIGGTPGANNSNSNSFSLQGEEDPEEESLSEPVFEPVSTSTQDVVDEVVSDESSFAEAATEDVENEESNISYKLGDVVVNEFVSDPTDGEEEFIELYNATKEDVDLKDWTIEEGSGAKTNLSGIIQVNKFFVIEKPKGSLNNKMDIIILRDGTNNLIDKVAYGNWDDGNLENNAPATTDPHSIARKFDGHNTYNNANDFAVTTTITKNKSNIIIALVVDDDLLITNDELQMTNEGVGYDYSNNVIVTEIFPNPKGVDNEGEFIELYNEGDEDINLLGWKIGDNSKGRYVFKEDEIIKPGEYFAIYRSESKISLNNGGDSVKLYQPLKDEIYLDVKYDKAIEDWSFNFQLDFKDEWAWSETATPGEENNIKKINHPPVIDFDFSDTIPIATPTIFDSSDTVDIDGDVLTYWWDFGDGFINVLPIPEHTFFTAGVYNVSLIVDDGENEVSKEKIVRVVDKNVSLDIASSTKAIASNVIISEILPNPYGDDGDEEWIEIYNPNLWEVNLSGWTIDDGEGGSKSYQFQENTVIGANEYYLIGREDSKIGLNNGGDIVRLFNGLDEVISEVKYDESFEGESYAIGENGEWFWTSILTPGFDNDELRITNDELGLYNDELLWIDPVADSGIQSENMIIETDLDKIKDFVMGDFVRVSGLVAVEPGVFGSQYFYMVASSTGVQVYNYKKDFPSLRVGDYIEVSGELALTSGEMRIKIKALEGIRVIEYREEPQAQLVSSEEVNKNSVGQLVKITGEVVERKGSNIYFDDGIDEVLVYIKASTGISAKSFVEGEIYLIAGIVGQAKSGVRIMPRSTEDIIKKDVESGMVAKQKMPGQISATDNLIIAQRDKKLKLFQYLLTVSSGVIVLLGGFLVKKM